MSRRVAIGVWAISMGMVAVALIFIGLVPADRAPAGARLSDVLPILPLPLSAAAVGAVIGSRRPGNPIGRFLSLIGLMSGLQYAIAGYAIYGLFSTHSLPQADVAAWIFSWSGGLIGLLACPIIFRFPDGRLTLRRARIGLACGVISTAVIVLGIALVPGPLFNMSGVQNPFGLAGQEAFVLALIGVGSLLFLTTLALGGSTVYERYRRAVHRERLQLKWFLSGVAFAAVVSAASASLALFDFGLAKVGMAVAVSAIPVTVAIAVLRQHLYDIDVVINRALVYGATTALMAVAFLVGIAALQALLRPFTSGSEIAVAASTLASVALAQPLRARMQRVVDRRFYRSRYDAIRTLDAFSLRLRDEVDLDMVRADLVDAVQRTVQPAHASVWLR